MKIRITGKGLRKFQQEGLNVQQDGFVDNLDSSRLNTNVWGTNPTGQPSPVRIPTAGEFPAFRVDPNQKAAEYKGEVVIPGKKKKKPNGLLAANWMTMGLNAFAGGLEKAEQERFDRNRSIYSGFTDTYFPTVTNITSRGTTEINTGEMFPNQKVPVQFKGTPYFGSAQAGALIPSRPYDLSDVTAFSQNLNVDTPDYETVTSAPEETSSVNAPKSPTLPKTVNTSRPTVAPASTSLLQIPLSEDDIIDITKDNKFNFGKLTSKNGFVIHHTGGRGTVDGVVSTFKQRGYPAHYVIDRQANIYRFLPDGFRGQHMRAGQDAGKGLDNSNTEGVEIIASDDNDIKQDQIEAAIRLAKHLGYSSDQIFGHGQVNKHKQATEGQAVINMIKKLVENKSFNEGGEYELDDDEIDYILANGGEIEYL